MDAASANVKQYVVGDKADMSKMDVCNDDVNKMKFRSTGSMRSMFQKINVKQYKQPICKKIKNETKYR